MHYGLHHARNLGVVKLGPVEPVVPQPGDTQPADRVEQSQEPDGRSGVFVFVFVSPREHEIPRQRPGIPLTELLHLGTMRVVQRVGRVVQTVRFAGEEGGVFVVVALVIAV